MCVVLFCFVLFLFFVCFFVCFCFVLFFVFLVRMDHVLYCFNTFISPFNFLEEKNFFLYTLLGRY